MTDAATSRVWASLTDEEAEEVTKAAKARGLLPSELARMALLSFIRQSAPEGGDAPISEVPAIARLEALAETLERQVGALNRMSSAKGTNAAT
jgi:hypothetical protein